MEAVIGFTGIVASVIVIAMWAGARRKNAQNAKPVSQTAQRCTKDDGVLLI